MSTLWTPAEITTALWLDGDDSATVTLSGSDVTQWADKSGNAVNYTVPGSYSSPSTDTLNGKTAIRFDNSGNERLSASGFAAGEVSVFVAMQRDSGAGNGILFGNGSSTAIYAPAMQNGSAAAAYSGFGFPTTFINGETPGTINRDTFYDALDGSTSVLSMVGANMWGGAFGIGHYATSTNWPVQGLVGEVIGLAGSPTTEVRQLIEGYLAWKWGSQASLPADHPYKSAAPTLPEETSTGEVTGTSTATASGSSGSTGAASRLNPLGLFLVRMSLPDEANTEVAPEPADDPIPDVGNFWNAGGGYVGGYISTNQDGVATHVLIVADASIITGAYDWSAYDASASSLIDGPGNFAKALAVATTGQAPLIVQQQMNDAAIGGFADWYIPAQNELTAIYANLKPSADLTFTGVQNPWAVPPIVDGEVNGVLIGQTPITAFQSGQPQAFDISGVGRYASSSQSNGGYRTIYFVDGSLQVTATSTARQVRAIRRVAV